MKIGNKVVVVNEPPYDLFGITNRDCRFIEITVTEEIPNVPGEFTRDSVSTGYKGIGSDGYEYGYDYPYYNQGYNSTPWIRYISNENFDNLSETEKEELVKDDMWSDVTNFICPAKAKFCETFEYIDFCEKHQTHFYTRNGCFYCRHNVGKRPNEVNKKEHSWKGWY